MHTIAVATVARFGFVEDPKLDVHIDSHVNKTKVCVFGIEPGSCQACRDVIRAVHH